MKRCPAAGVLSSSAKKMNAIICTSLGLSRAKKSSFLTSLRPCETEIPVPGAGCPPSLLQQAYSLQRQGETEAAVALYEKSISECGECEVVVVNLGACYLRQRLAVKARRLYSLTKFTSFEILFNYALATCFVGKRYEALKAFRDCLKTVDDEQLQGDICAAIQELETLSPVKPQPLWRTETDFDFSILFESKELHKHQSHTSLSSTQFHQYHLSALRPVKLRKEEKPHTPAKKQRPKSALKPAVTRLSFSNEDSRQKPRVNVWATFDPSVKVARKPRVRHQSSFVEEDIETDTPIQQMTAASQELRDSVTSMSQQLARISESSVLTEPLCIPRSKKLRAEELEVVRREMVKPPQFRDLSVLVSIITRLRFFEKFKADLRRELLRVGGYTKVPERGYVFHQGEASSHVYVIISGSVSVWRQAKEYGADPLIVHTLYEGDSFGELSLFTESINKKVERSASCQAVEDTDLYFLTKTEYHRIMIKEVEISLQAKLSFLLTLPFFAGVNEFVLVPLAATLSPLRFKLGEYILRIGEVPKGLHIVASGRCNVLSEGFSLASRTKSLSSSMYGVDWTVVSDQEREEKGENFLSVETIAEDAVLQRELKDFFRVSNLDQLLRKFSICRERVVEEVMAEGCFFSSRCLFVFSQNKITPCKYAVVADSAEVVVYVVTSGQVPLLGEKLSSHMTHILSKYEDPDCPPAVSRENIRREFTRWKKYKGKVVGEVLRRRPT